MLTMYPTYKATNVGTLYTAALKKYNSIHNQQIHVHVQQYNKCVEYRCICYTWKETKLT